MLHTILPLLQLQASLACRRRSLPLPLGELKARGSPVQVRPMDRLALTRTNLRLLHRRQPLTVSYHLRLLRFPNAPNTPVFPPQARHKAAPLVLVRRLLIVSQYQLLFLPLGALKIPESLAQVRHTD